MAKSGVERVRAYRDRKSRGVKTVVDRVEELEWKIKALTDQVESLQGVVNGLIPQPLSQNVTPNNALAQLRAQIAAVPPVRPERVVDPFGPGRAIPNLPVQPYGEWEPS